ncbi:ATP-binding cassette domain-containing protein [Desulfosarcina ovata]|uniref:Peptide ABC transporter ATP-binding protein n=1 Tax=Desulfosarcina ovata subsp. ovata TaxID=2752305 RepID=A0A5K8AAR4_9BACT|nr:ATP-binding cassette domain-containing protein [Desulfosarcina ovata]BBO89609.1 peptide ABC transporter ATP-binding protein [Desulfosarcina ovata subsp. ovata]
MIEPVIEVINLKKDFQGGLFRNKKVSAVDGVSFRIKRGEALGLLGESGSGKSTLGRCLLRLIDPTAGEIYFKGKNILAMNGDFRPFRKRMQIIFQDADGALNPRMTVKDLLLEPLKVHRQLNGRAQETAAALMAQVNLPADLLGRYPNALSGGQRQRIAISRAISIKPEFIVADEAIASLDLIGQAQVMALFNRLKAEQQTTFLIISHSLRFIRQTTDAVAVMFTGKLVEIGKTTDILNHPAHPYTQALLSSTNTKLETQS